MQQQIRNEVIVVEGRSVPMVRDESSNRNNSEMMLL